ncbi:MAG: PHP domain-containing protein [Spirochaetes bacterium]|nr:PHP domain-containing protein [Spirochaetota bacterium]
MGRTIGAAKERHKWPKHGGRCAARQCIFGSMDFPGIGFGNYHTHTRHCDGKGAPDEFAEAALQKGMPRLGFSGHNVLPFPAEWTMPAGNLESYLREVRETRERYRGRLEVFLGMEVDYLPGITSPVDPVVRSLGLDFIIGSVHFIASVNGEYPWTVDGSPEEFALGLRESFGGDVRALTSSATSISSRRTTVTATGSARKPHGTAAPAGRRWRRWLALAAFSRSTRAAS